MQALEQDPAWRGTLGTTDGFARAHAGFAASLAAHWRRRVAEIAAGRESSGEGEEPKRVSRELTVGQKYKLVDLFVRHLWIERSDRTLDADSNLPHARTPLDRKSLHVLSATFGGILMAPEFSMGMVTSEAQYRYCQALVQMVCQEQGGTPLLFDVFAWHHPRANELYGPAGHKDKTAKSASRRARDGEPRATV